MKEKIKAIVGINIVNNGEGSYIIRGNSQKLKEIRTMLDDAGYTDDTDIVCSMLGIPEPTENIGTIIVANENGAIKGYMATALELEI